MPEQHVIPAEYYDALRALAFLHKGIGGGQVDKYDRAGNSIPCCLVGFAFALASSFRIRAAKALESPPTVASIMMAFDPEKVNRAPGAANDEIVERINRRNLVKNPLARVSFEEYAAERGWVRGDA